MTKRINEHGYEVMTCKNCKNEVNTDWSHSEDFCSIRCENFYEGMRYQEDQIRMALIAGGKAL